LSEVEREWQRESLGMTLADSVKESGALAGTADGCVNRTGYFGRGDPALQVSTRQIAWVKTISYACMQSWSVMSRGGLS